MARAIIPVLILFIICFFGYKQYSRARTVAEVNFKIDRMIEDVENYNTVSAGMTTEQQQRMQNIRDSISQINNQNRLLREQVNVQKAEIASLKDSLSKMGNDYEKVVGIHIKNIEDKFRELENGIGALKGENDELRTLNSEKGAKIQELQFRLIAKTQEVDSLNQVIMEKNGFVA